MVNDDRMVYKSSVTSHRANDMGPIYDKEKNHFTEMKGYRDGAYIENSYFPRAIARYRDRVYAYVMRGTGQPRLLSQPRDLSENGIISRLPVQGRDIAS